MKQISLSLALGAAFLGATGFGLCQTARTVYLYNSSLGAAPGASLAARSGPWGNGSIKTTRQAIDYEGASVLELETKNFAEGARFDLVNPLDIEPYRAQGFVRLRLRFQDSVATAGTEAGAGPGMPGMGGPGMGMPGMGMPGIGVPGFRGAPQFRPPAGGALPPIGGLGAPGGAGAEPGFNPDGGAQLTLPAVQATDISSLRVTFLMENGAMMGRIPVNLEETQPDENGWRLFVLSIKDMTQTEGAKGLVRRVLLTSDNTDTFFMAQAAIVIETGQMTVSIRRPRDPEGLPQGEFEFKPGTVNLIADVEAGAADPIIEWNFDADNIGNLPAPAINGAPAPGLGVDVPGMATAPGFPNLPGAPRRPTPNPVADPDAGAGAAFTGPRIDARGLTASFTYPNEEQNYRVEVTVRDKSGQKQPVTASALIKIRG